jgi:photosystem II stability/assembly factor-like uncharacterized protein
MFNLSLGWSIARSGGASDNQTYQILRTIDSGCNWQITKSLQPAPGQDQPTVFFISADTVWAFVGSQSYHTSDSGKTWTEQQLSLNVQQDEYVHVTHLVFSDAQHGWLLAEVGQQPFVSQMASQNVLLLSTMDGGQQWTQLLRVDSSQHKNIPGQLPSQSSYSGMSFLDQNTGWISGMSFGQEQSHLGWLYITHNGGHTWQEQKLTLPNGLASTDGLKLSAPRFFGEHDGILTGSIDQSSQPSGLCNFFTHDAGATWQNLPFLRIDNYTELVLNPDNDPNRAMPAIYLTLPLPVFTDMRYGWLGSSVLRTTDGGQTWEHAGLTLPVGSIDGQVQFINSQSGWAWSGLGGKKGTSSLFETTNGGKTWTQQMYSVI